MSCRSRLSSRRNRSTAVRAIGLRIDWREMRLIDEAIFIRRNQYESDSTTPRTVRSGGPSFLRLGRRGRRRGSPPGETAAGAQQAQRTRARPRAGGSRRKVCQLCRQVAETLDEVLADCGDGVLRGLRVATVVPYPNASRLLVTVAPVDGRLTPDAGPKVVSSIWNGPAVTCATRSPRPSPGSAPRSCCTGSQSPHSRALSHDDARDQEPAGQPRSSCPRFWSLALSWRPTPQGNAAQAGPGLFRNRTYQSIVNAGACLDRWAARHIYP